MKNKIIGISSVSFFILLFGISSNAQELKAFDFTVRLDSCLMGEVSVDPVISPFLASEYEDWEYESDKSIPVNVLKCENGVYSFSGMLKYPVPFTVTQFDSITKTVISSSIFFIQNGSNDITINRKLSENPISFEKISEVNEELQLLDSELANFQIMDPYTLRSEEENKTYIEKLENYIIEHPNSHPALWLLIIESVHRGGSYSKELYLAAQQFSDEFKRNKPLIVLLRNLENNLKRIQNSETSLNIGSVFPFDSFNYGNELEKKVKLKEFTIVDFWASWCGPCLADFKELDTELAQKEYPDLGIVLVSIDNQEKQELAQKKLEKFNFKHELLFDENGERGFHLFFNIVPTKFLLSRNGEILLKNFEVVDLIQFLEK